MEPNTYCASTLDPEKSSLRERSFTNWMSRDLSQSTVEFCRSIGLIPVYAEAREDGKFRYLFWNPPQGTAFQIKSGNNETTFRELHQKADQAGLILLTLHISDGENRLYSAVWISPDSQNVACDFLSIYGISATEKPQ